MPTRARDGLSALRDDINNLNYHDIGTIDAALAEATTPFDALAGLAATKRATLEAAQAVEQAKEDARLAYAAAAAAAVQHFQATTEQISDYSFGTSNAEVVAYEAILAEEDEKLNQLSASKIAEVFSSF